MSDRYSNLTPEILASRVLFEDADIIVVDKPPGIPSQPTLDPKRPNLVSAIESYLRSQTHEAVYVGQHHRLDLETSGVMIFTKAKRANAGLAKQFKFHTAQKIYWCVVTPAVKEHEFEVCNHLAIDKNRKTHIKSVRSGGDKAETFFRVLATNSKLASFLEAMPRTGRRHQIRVHLSERGTPIAGDSHYGSRTPTTRVMLHARALQVLHPLSGEAMTFTAPVPQDFRDCCEHFRLNFSGLS